MCENGPTDSPLTLIGYPGAIFDFGMILEALLWGLPPIPWNSHMSTL